MTTTSTTLTGPALARRQAEVDDVVAAVLERVGVVGRRSHLGQRVVGLALLGLVPVGLLRALAIGGTLGHRGSVGTSAGRLAPLALVGAGATGATSGRASAPAEAPGCRWARRALRLPPGVEVAGPHAALVGPASGRGLAELAERPSLAGLDRRGVRPCPARPGWNGHDGGGASRDGRPRRGRGRRAGALERAPGGRARRSDSASSGRAATSGSVNPTGRPRVRCILATSRRSSGATNDTTTPVAPARPVRPERWM